MYVAEQKDADSYVACGSVQSVLRNLENFDPKYVKEFGWELITPANMKDKFMSFIKKSKDIEYIEISRYIRRKLSKDEIAWIIEHSDKKLDEYFGEQEQIKVILGEKQ